MFVASTGSSITSASNPTWANYPPSESGPDEKLRKQFLFCLVATVIDGLGTIIHLGRGAHEANPVWAGLIDLIGVVPVMGIRVAIGVFLLCLLISFWRKPLAQFGIKIMVAAFVPLTIYHLFLLVYLPTLV